jgi:hypothetical protein
MVWLRARLWLCLVFLGCQTLPAFQRDDKIAVSAGEEKAPAAPTVRSANTASAGTVLAQYLKENPTELTVRERYAELLFQERRLAEARREFERFIAGAQEKEGPASERLIHCHSRLVEIADSGENDYDEHLHRGIGLCLLARKRSELGAMDGQLPAEGLLFKAAAELTLAQVEKPDEARPCWYLYQVWSALGQSRPARRQLCQAESAAPFSYLTPAESRQLTVACGNQFQCKFVSKSGD